MSTLSSVRRSNSHSLRLVGSFISLFALLFGATGWAQQSGGLDTATYGPYSGLAYGQFPPTTEQQIRVHDAIVLPDDRVVAGATCVAVGASPAGNRFCLVEWSKGGSTVNLHIGPTAMTRVNADAGGAIARQPDGKLVLAAPCKSTPIQTVSELCAVRFNANFSVDTSFAVGLGNVAPSGYLSNNSYANAVAIQPDGKIIVAGQCGGPSGTLMCAARFLSDGQDDSSFGDSINLRFIPGTYTAAPFDRASRIALSPAGQIYLGGQCKQDAGGLSRACVSRLNADGSIDPNISIGAGKPLTLPLLSGGSASDSVFDMRVQANGEFVFAGTCFNLGSGTNVPCALRMGTPNAGGFTPGTWYLGATVSTGTSILREPAAGGAFSIRRISLQPDGKMLALLKDEASNTLYRVRRYDEDGSRDANWAEPSFDLNAATDGASYATALALTQQSTGSVMVAGFTGGGASGVGQARVLRLENRTNAGNKCNTDIDGDGIVSPATDGLLLSRAAAGMTGNAVIANALGAGAKRNTWPLIRDYLITQCGMTNVMP
ncbi:MAG: hypothetical protein ABIZ64_08300 [Casimicrobium sp.]